MNITAILVQKTINDARIARLYQYQQSLEKRVNEEFLKQCAERQRILWTR